MKVCEHGLESFLIGAIPCPTVIKDDLYNDLSVRQNNCNLVFK